MSGIYIHIPFCRKKCSYCNFFSVSSLKNKDAFLSSLIKEIEIRRNYLENETVETVYFGGGTPSLLTKAEIEMICNKIQKTFQLAQDHEFTFEANPESLDANYLRELINNGINRLSIGIQSFYDDDLKYLDRIHSAKQAERSIEDAISAGFKNLSIDLIYSIPTSTDGKLIKNLEKVKSYGIDHFSAYSLTIEPGTILDNEIKNGRRVTTDENMELKQFQLLMDFAAQYGYEQYEISNFCRNKKYSKHNTAYWKGVHYLGLGPSAHSYDGNSRQWNTSVLNDYIHSIRKGTVPYESELLTLEQKYNEYILTSLRTVWGCDTKFIFDKFGERFFQQFIINSEKHISEDRLEKHNGVFYLTKKGKFLADQITSDLFF